jgi:hypothetical protein
VSGVSPTRPVAPTGYILDICRYCGHLAVWPGCLHWQAHDDWTLSVRVAPSQAARRNIQVAMDEANGRDR